MLSILIPIYNYHIYRLVADVHQQAAENFIDFEIIAMEDGSTLYVEENKRVNDFEHCRHMVLTHNIGRSAIRNRLADEAKYNHLLFMDCDAEVGSPEYIAKYLSFCREDCIVIGGTAYDPNEKDPHYSLRLKYGRKREARTASERGRNNLSTFNYLISKNIFNRVRFDENIQGYGHEDMLFGHQLHQLGYDCIQIDNPLIHKGLDNNTSFLMKTEEGTRNLYTLYRTGHYPYLDTESKLLSTYLLIRKWKMTRLFAMKYDFTAKLLRRQLCGTSPSLLLYDWYKILYLCKTSLAK